MCDMAYIVSKFLKPLMQIVTTEYTEYDMSLITTKCFNTAVLLMYLFLGKSAIESTRVCDVENVRARRRTTREAQNGTAGDIDLGVATRLAADVLGGADKTRTLYYVLITDQYVKSSLSGGDVKYFPGHVFIIDKHWSEAGRVFFNLYESYVNHYTLEGQLQRFRSFSVHKLKMALVLNGLLDLFDPKKTLLWNERATATWKMLTGIDASQYEGYEFAGRVNLCYTKIRNDACLTNLERVVREKLAEVRAMPAEAKARVYGSEHLFRKSKEKPLTNGEMEEQLALLLKVLEEKSVALR